MERGDSRTAPGQAQGTGSPSTACGRGALRQHPQPRAENLCSPSWGVGAGHRPNRTGTAASLGPLAEHTVLTTRVASPWPQDATFPHQRTEDGSSYARRPGPREVGTEPLPPHPRPCPVWCSQPHLQGPRQPCAGPEGTCTGKLGSCPHWALEAGKALCKPAATQADISEESAWRTSRRAEARAGTDRRPLAAQSPRHRRRTWTWRRAWGSGARGHGAGRRRRRAPPPGPHQRLCLRITGAAGRLVVSLATSLLCHESEAVRD